jgi:hypothetical protein
VFSVSKRRRESEELERYGRRCSFLHHPRVSNHFGDGNAVVDVAVEHRADEVNAIFRERKEGDSEGVVKDLVDAVERVLLVDNGVKKDTQSPDILFLAPIRPAL